MTENAELVIQKLSVYKDRMIELKELFRYDPRLKLKLLPCLIFLNSFMYVTVNVMIGWLKMD